MDYGMYASAAGALANSYRQDVIANNLANVDTVAFKRDLALFQGRPTAAKSGGSRRFTAPMLEGIGGGLFALPTYTVQKPASLETTGRKLDVGLNGEGFLRVQDGERVLLTRDGRLGLNERNELVMQATQMPVLGLKGRPIILDPGLLGEVEIGATGDLSQGGEVLDRLSVVTVANPQGLRKRGENLFEMKEGMETQRVATPILQGSVESSGVNSVQELAEMIKTQRLFESNLGLLKIQDQLTGLAATRLAQIG